MGQNVQHHGKAIRQAAVLAVWHGRICLITSSSEKHWLVPKGHLEHGDKLLKTAQQEAWEEAGLIGHISPRPVGVYEYTIERFVDCFGPALRTTLYPAIAEMQQVLGDVNDHFNAVQLYVSLGAKLGVFLSRRRHRYESFVARLKTDHETQLQEG